MKRDNNMPSYGIVVLWLATVSAYTRLSYQEIEEKIVTLRSTCSSLLNVTTAQEAYGTTEPSDCNGCKQWVLEFTKAPAGSPHVFFSGALHGNERLGPITTIALAEFLCESFTSNPWVQHLVSTTRIIMMPMPNAQGYYLNDRGETVHGHQLDPNRDFGYFVQPSQCMQTTTAQSIFAVLSRRIVVLSITFHGGTRAVGYPWGAPNHMQGAKSTEAPDETAAHSIGSLAISYSNLTTQLGPMTDTVYEVAGGMEDWAYAASWEGGDAVTKCSNSDFQVESYNSYSFRQLMYLVEMDNKKDPENASLGTRDEIFTGNTLVPTYIRFSLAAISMAKPYIDAYYVPKPSSVHVFWKVRGCEVVDETYLLVSPYDFNLWLDLSSRDYLLSEDLKSFERYGGSQTGVCGLDHPTTFHVELALNQPSILLVAAKVDGKWTLQTHPDPEVLPQSHIVRMRSNDYFVQGGNFTLVSNSTIYSAVLKFNDTPPATRLSATLMNMSFNKVGELQLEEYGRQVYLKLSVQSGRATIDLGEFGDLREPEMQTWGPAIPLTRLACRGVPDVGYFATPYEVTFANCGMKVVSHFIARTVIVNTEQGMLFGVLETKDADFSGLAEEGICVIASPEGPTATLFLEATGLAVELSGYFAQPGNYSVVFGNQTIPLELSHELTLQAIRLERPLSSFLGRPLIIRSGSEELGSCVVGSMNTKHSDPYFSHSHRGGRQLQSMFIISGGSGLSVLVILLACYCGNKRTYQRLSDAGTSP